MRNTPSKAMSRAAASSRGPLPSVAVVASRYHAQIPDRLVQGAAEVYLDQSPVRRRSRDRAGQMHVFHAPGSFELVALSLAAAESGRFDGVVALGCIVKGQTRHDEYIAQA